MALVVSPGDVLGQNARARLGSLEVGVESGLSRLVPDSLDFGRLESDFSPTSIDWALQSDFNQPEPDFNQQSALTSIN